jgi:hypothetical protein
MNTTSKAELMTIYEFIGPGDTPTRVSPGNGEVFLVEQGRFEAPVKYAQGFQMLGFATLGEPRLKPRANGDSRGIGAHMGEDQSKKGVSK